MKKIWIVEYSAISSTIHSKLFLEESEARAFYETLHYCGYRHIGRVDDIWHFAERSKK